MRSAFRVVRSEGDTVTAARLGGAPLKEFFENDAVLVVREGQGNNLVYDAVVRACRPPDTLVFRVRGAPQERSKREYVRIDDYLCLVCTVLRGGEAAVLESFRQRAPRKPALQLASPTWFTQRDDRGDLVEVEKEILKVLVALDQKIDAVIGYLADGNRGALLSFKPRRVNLSGSGMCFPMTDPVSPGDFLEIRLFLPDASGIPVNILGVVVRATAIRGEGDGGADVAVSFHHIEEEDRERLVRHIFNRQREAIRSGAERKGGENDAL